MHRPDHPSADNGQFTDGDPGQGIDATVLQASWINAVLEELVGVVEGGGETLDKLDNAQVLKAINSLVASRAENKNQLFNPRFDVWQLGDNTATGAVVEMGPDGWYMSPFGAKIDANRIGFAAGQTIVPGSPRYYAEFSKTGIPTQAPWVACFVENIRPWSQQSITLSFWAKAPNPVTIDLAAIADYGAGSSSPDEAESEQITVTTAWTKFERTFTMPSNANKDIRDDSHMRFEWRFPNDNVAAALHLSQVQVEPGTAATEFLAPVPHEALARAQRYVEKSWPGEGRWGDVVVATGSRGAVAAYQQAATNVLVLQRNFRVTKAKVPVVTWHDPNSSASNFIFSDGASIPVTATMPSTEATGYPTAGSLPSAGLFSGQWLAEAHPTL